MTGATSTYPVIGQAATTAAAMRAAATLIESAGICGLPVTCDSDQVCIQAGDHLGDPPARAGMVARLAAVIGATAVRADSAASPLSWIRADGAVSGLRVRAFTPIPVQHAGDLPLASSDAGQIAQAAAPSLPPGWRWLTSLDPAPHTGTEAA
ncbi:MAG: hypothetical protein ACLP7J_10230 [Streptosporangiaceae bacterium]